MAAAGRLEEGFDVFVNDSCSRLRRDYAHDLERFVDSFACWQPADSTARKFNGAAIESFLSKVEQEEEFIAAVIGFNEFPHTHGRTLVGSNREIVREYWFEVDTGDARIAGQDGFVILHVHFAGKWHELRDQRDRSTISQINIRHTARREEDAWKKCADLDKWREQYGEFVVRRFPGGWKWKERPEVSPALHKLLAIADKCTRFVRGKSAPTENVPTGKRRALIIANSNYDDTR
eukprot:309466-Rhodomonas_salina.1